jgi:hypothetical protein
MSWHTFTDKPVTPGMWFVAARVNANKQLEGQVFVYDRRGWLAGGVLGVVAPRPGGPDEVTDFLVSCGFTYWMALPDVEVAV